jgi:hypothetical protein
MSATLFALSPVRRATRRGRVYDVPRPDGTLATYPSVTSVLEVIAKPALAAWAAKEERALVAATAADLYTETAAHAQFPRASFVLALERRLGQALAHVGVSEQALAIGTQVHARIEWTLKRAQGALVATDPPVLTKPAALAFQAFQSFAQAVSLTPQRIESIVYSHVHRYAGTLDLVATLDAAALLRQLQRQGAVAPKVQQWLATRPTVTALVDFKTGRGVYKEALLQSVAYQQALREMGHGRVDGGLVVRLPKDPADRRGLEVVVVPSVYALFPTFAAVRQLWDWHAAPSATKRVTAAVRA